VDFKSTSELTSELMNAPDIDSYISENCDLFTDDSISGMLNKLYESKDISKAALARKAGMSEVYLHQVFSGRRNPSRDRLLSLCIGMGASMDETQAMLKLAGYAELYPRNRRDAIISFGILHGEELEQINDKLFLEKEKTLF
jgi:transcriptional regulator with XRE-family HTH domain